MIIVAVISSILIVITIAGLSLNAAVLVALAYKKFWRTPSTFLLFNLSLVDFLTCILIIPFFVVPGLAGVYNFGNSGYERCQSCHIGSIIVIWLFYTSMHILAIMSLDRLVYIKKPLEYENWITVSRLAIALIVIWIICLILAIPPLFGFGVIEFSTDLGTCLTSHVGRTRLGPGYAYIAFVLSEDMFPLSIIIITEKPFTSK